MQANTDHTLFRPVREIVEYAYGPTNILEGSLSSVGGIESAFICGSWAARSDGIPGADPDDIDVLVIGRPDRADLHEPAGEAEGILRREGSTRSVGR